MATDKLTCACATFINPEGEGVKRDLERFGITHKELHIVGNGNINGIDLAYFDRTEEVMKKAESIREKDCITFCFVGRIVGDKGMNELAEAFARLEKEFSSCRLLLVGDFEEKLDPVLPKTKRMFLEDSRVTFVGWQQDIRPYLAASDVFVFPSYREGFPNVVLQAGAMNLPSIVTDINGSSEIIRDGVNGVIIPPRNTEVLWRAMRNMLTDEAARQKMAANARNLIGSRYDRMFLWQELRKTYKSLE